MANETHRWRYSGTIANGVTMALLVCFFSVPYLVLSTNVPFLPIVIDLAALLSLNMFFCRGAMELSVQPHGGRVKAEGPSFLALW